MSSAEEVSALQIRYRHRPLEQPTGRFLVEGTSRKHTGDAFHASVLKQGNQKRVDMLVSH
jgi:hypothetical protein